MISLISLFALYYGVVFENGSELVLNSVFIGNARMFLVVLRFFKTQSF
ncbi:hypothetical protein QAP01_01935 [Helicobacter pylori]|nr:hypothetical protein [Helicobacter pylori]WJJ01987.1 hypothetical protein QAP01_01935 [Helicobacter pylori]